jgi:hypothetical protein
MLNILYHNIIDLLARNFLAWINIDNMSHVNKNSKC